MTQLENLKNQIKELEKSCDEARDRIKNENLPFLNIYENRAAFFTITVSDYIENIAF